MAQRLLRLAKSVSSCALWVGVCHSLDSVRQAAEEFIRDTAGGALVRSIGRWRRGLIFVVARLALLSGRDARAAGVGREVGVDRVVVFLAMLSAASVGLAGATGAAAWSRVHAGGGHVLFYALGLGFRAFEMFESCALLLQFIACHLFLHALENAEFEDAAHNAGELCTLAHRLCKPCGES